MAYRIDDDGTIIRTDDNKSENNGRSHSLIVVLALLLITAIGFAIAFGVEKSELEGKNQYLQRELLYAKENYAELNENYVELERNKSVVGSSFDRYLSRYSPIIIEDIEVGNESGDGTMETDYGRSIYSYSSMYLKPRIRYVGYKSESITLKVKLFNAYGNLSTGNSSPRGYSYSTDKYVYEGENTMSLSGWGNSSRGNWPSGKYRYEIWYGDVCLATKSFTIY